MQHEVDGLKPLAEVMNRDEPWRYLGNRSLEQHYDMVGRYSLHPGVPNKVVQHFESAKNTWLYAFFSYRLLHVALMQLHVAGEVAMKERAKCAGINTKGKVLNDLLNLALERRWLLDVDFEVTADRTKRQAEHLEMLRFSVEHEPHIGPQHEQDYAKGLVAAFRSIRNALAHGEVVLRPNVSWDFMAVRDLINQMFPASGE